MVAVICERNGRQIFEGVCWITDYNGGNKMKLYWANFIIGSKRPYLLSHSNPYPTLEKANDSVKKTLESMNVILSYIQEQDTETGKMIPVIVTPYVNSMGAKI